LGQLAGADAPKNSKKISHRRLTHGITVPPLPSLLTRSNLYIDAKTMEKHHDKNTGLTSPT